MKYVHSQKKGYLCLSLGLYKFLKIVGNSELLCII